MGFLPSRYWVFPSLVDRLISAVMRLDRTTKGLTAWIASLAILMATLAPAVTVAVRTDIGGAWAEVCSASGPKLVQSGDVAPVSTPAPLQAHPLEHCPWCSLQLLTGWLPHPIAALALWVAPSFEVPEPQLKAARSQTAWTGPPSRAPGLLIAANWPRRAESARC